MLGCRLEIDSVASRQLGEYRLIIDVDALFEEELSKFHAERFSLFGILFIDRSDQGKTCQGRCRKVLRAKPSEEARSDLFSQRCDIGLRL